MTGIKGSIGWAAACILLTATYAAGETDERLEVVDRAIAVHGGKLFQATETQLKLCSKSGCFDVRARVDGDSFEYEVQGRVRDGVRRVLSTNDRVEVTLDGAPVDVPAADEQAYRDWVMARVYFCFLPYRLNDPGVLKQDLGVEDWDGTALRKVRVTFPPGSSTDAEDVYLYWFEEDTGRLGLFAYSYHGDPGGIRFRRLKNFRKVGGLLFFDQDNLGAEGPDADLDALTPSSVPSLRSISQVELRDIEVRSLSGAATRQPNR